MPKFDWNQFPAEGAAKPADGAKGKFDWNQFPAEDIGKLPPESRGVQVYDQPAGPEQASAIDRFKERVQDPQRWKAILVGQGPRAPEMVQGDVPLVIPAGVVPRLAKYATALAEGTGAGYAAGRTALATGQGAVMSAGGGKEGESWQDKADRMKSGAKLSGGIQIAAESLPVVGKIVAPLTRKLGSALSGVAESLVENYAKRTDFVNKIIRENGGDMTAAADQVRTELSAGIQGAKQKLNGQISSTLADSSPDPVHSIQPLIDKLEAAKSKLNPNLKADAVKEIDDIIAKITTEASQSNADGLVNASQLYQIKQFLNESSSSAYNKGGQIFTRASESARAAKDAAGAARATLRTAAPEISQADAQLSRLHSIESRLNRNLLAPGKPDGAFMAAGAGTNPRNAANLRALEEVSGVPVMQRAKDLATAREFANPSVLPSDFTGKALARMAVGAGVGGYLDGKEGAAIGGALASPMGIKVAVNTANVAKRIPGVAQTIGAAKFIRENPIASQAGVQMGAKRIRDANPDKPAGTDVPPSAPTLGDQEKQPAKGYDKWAQKGLDKLGIKDPQISERLLQDKQARRLLIEASDLPPGSRGMKRIMEQIQKGLGESNDSGTAATTEVLRRERKPARGR